MKIGIIVGRFQLDTPHEGHRKLIETVLRENDEVIVFVGQSPVISEKNPLTASQVIERLGEQRYFKKLKYLILPDTKYDEDWVAELDRRILEYGPYGITLYGGRDSFLKIYNGIFPTKEVDFDIDISASELREGIRNKQSLTREEARGMIISHKYRYPTAYPTVDIAIIDKKSGEMLMGKKAGEKNYRFVGGFVDPTDASFEEAARRELKEETGIEVDSLICVGSAKINDWRYRGTRDGIITTLFKVYVDKRKTSFKAQDDICSLEWVKNPIVEKEHNCLLQKLSHKKHWFNFLRGRHEG